MHRFLITVSLFLIFGTSAFSQTPAKVPAAGEEVMATVSRWAVAVQNRDTAALDELFSDELVVTAPDGTTRGKQEELKILQPKEGMRTVSVANDDLRIRLIGDAAVVTGLVRMKFVVNEKESSQAFRYTAVFAKENGRWRLAALQSAYAPKEQK